jgi:hypothetical protein
LNILNTYQAIPKITEVLLRHSFTNTKGIYVLIFILSLTVLAAAFFSYRSGHQVGLQLNSDITTDTLLALLVEEGYVDRFKSADGEDTLGPMFFCPDCNIKDTTQWPPKAKKISDLTQLEIGRLFPPYSAEEES